MSNPSAGRVLIVDDEEFIRDLVTSYLRSRQYLCEAASSGQAALELAQTGTFDVVLTDIQMPGMDGMRLIRKLQQVLPDIPVVLVTAQSSFDTAVQALQLGAYDYVVKPFPLEALEAAVLRALEKRRLQRENTEYQRLLRDKIEKKSADLLSATATVELQREEIQRAVGELRGSFDATVNALVNAIAARDSETRDHCRRARDYTLLLAGRLGLSGETLRDTGWGALLHDVGKIGIPDSVLLKPGPLTADEWTVMKRHPLIGHRMITGIPFLAGAAEVVLAHHEKWDGSGYPLGLAGDEIPIGARCFAIADAVETITSQRCYKLAQPFDAACDEIYRGSGGHFDPELVKLFFEIPRTEFERIQRLYRTDAEEMIEESIRARPHPTAAERLQSEMSGAELFEAQLAVPGPEADAAPAVLPTPEPLAELDHATTGEVAF